MSTTGKFAAAVLAFLLLVFGSTVVQVSISQAEEHRIAASDEAETEQAAALARWEQAVTSARQGAEPVAEAARADAESAGTLATADDVEALETAADALDEALGSRDLGAIAAARDGLRAAHGVFLEAVAVNAEELVTTNASADQAVKDAATTAIGTMRSIVADGLGAGAALLELRSATDRVVASHTANVAAAAAAAAAAETAAAGDDADDPDPTGSTGSPGVFDPSASRPPVPPLTIEARGDFRPGCPVILEWDWWHPDATGYVVVDPGYPYDIQVMEIEGWSSSVKSLPCAEE